MPGRRQAGDAQRAQRDGVAVVDGACAGPHVVHGAADDLALRQRFQHVLVAARVVPVLVRGQHLRDRHARGGRSGEHPVHLHRVHGSRLVGGGVHDEVAEVVGQHGHHVHVVRAVLSFAPPSDDRSESDAAGNQVVATGLARQCVLVSPRT